MNEFKFSCPACQQHIRVSGEFVGQRIECPACKASLIVPVPDATKEVAPPAPPESEATITASTPSAAEAEQPSAAANAPTLTTVPPISDERIAVLTPEIKVQIISEARSRLADKSHWLAGKNEAGQYNYAARREGDELVPVSPTDIRATHFSLFGAMMLEFHRRNVTRVTVGRQKFLDEELTAAIHQLLGRQPGEKLSSESDREALDHEQCLAVLDLLERRQKQESKAVKQQQASRKIEYIRLPDLVQKMEGSAQIRPEEVVCALYYEIEELKKRIEEFEHEKNPLE